MKIAILTCSTWQGLFEKETAFAKKINFPDTEIDVLAWDDEAVDWQNYDYLLFRTTWDYFNVPEKFDAWLQKIQHLGIKTLNSIEVIRRNQHKFYLQDLERQGIAIIPTIFIPKRTVLDTSFLQVLQQKNWAEAIIKPAVSGGAYRTLRFDESQYDAVILEYNEILENRDILLQPFLPEILTEGELSIFFFNGKYSHAVLKKPIDGDFRVQEQFGGKNQIYRPSAELIATAQHIAHSFDPDLLYARVDGVLQNNNFLLMELELIEPDLYFHAHPDAEPNFLAALRERILKQAFF